MAASVRVATPTLFCTRLLKSFAAYHMWTASYRATLFNPKPTSHPWSKALQEGGRAPQQPVTLVNEDGKNLVLPSMAPYFLHAFVETVRARGGVIQNTVDFTWNANASLGFRTHTTYTLQYQPKGVAFIWEGDTGVPFEQRKAEVVYVKTGERPFEPFGVWFTRILNESPINRLALSDSHMEVSTIVRHGSEEELGVRISEGDEVED